MKTSRFEARCLRAIVLMVVTVLAWLLTFGDVATADTYSNSAHGNIDPGYGVNRLEIDQPTGDCAHCHDAANSANCGAQAFMLFYDDAKANCDLFCFTCHSGFGAWQPVENYLYSITFGGYPPVAYETIYKQFCEAASMYGSCGSRHYLTEIHDSIKDNAYDRQLFEGPNLAGML